MKTNQLKDLGDICDYYSGTLARHGSTPRGVDWNGEASQMVRFQQLTKVISEPDGFSLMDLGCGYGALYDYLKSNFEHFDYHGYDISAEMIEAANARLADEPGVKLIHSNRSTEQFDYAIASGIFSVKLRNDDDSWRQYIDDTLDHLNVTGQKGFAFNCLSKYSDADRMQEHLYYADPGLLFERCKRKYSKQVALLHDYDLYEFTIIVRR